MKTGAQVGLAVVAGYVLGRYHKGKWALALAAMGAGKKLPGPQAAILEQGKKLLAANPVLSGVTQDVRDQLVGMGRSALTSAASRRIESFSDALRERSDLMRGTGDQAADEEPADEDTGDEDGGKRRSADDSGDEESGARPARRRAAQSSRASTSSKASGSGGTRSPRKTSSARTSSSARSSSSERASGSRGSSSSAGPRRRTAASGQEARPRRRSAGTDQEKAPASRKRSRSSSADKK